jgi:hypothetical protein
MELGLINTALTSIAKAINTVKDSFTNYYTTKSLSDATRLTRVEPLTIVSKDCLNIECMSDVNNVLLNMFAGYYLQAVHMLTTVNDVEVVRILDKLNPDRDETGFLLEEKVSRESLSTLSLESYKYSLPTSTRLALEAPGDKDGGKGPSGPKGKDPSEVIMDISNLSVGKLVNISITYNKSVEGVKDETASQVTIPVNFRLMVSAVPNSTIGHLLAVHKDDTSIVERFHAWRSGRISFIRDLIFCQDLIDENKRAMIGDETGTMLEIMRRVNNSKKYGLLTKNPSLVSASNLFVVTEEIARDLEGKLGGRLTNFKTREQAFENTYAMVIVVIDREWQRVTFYTRGIQSYTDLSYKELKSVGKDKGPDIMDILKSLNTGHAPVF